MDFFLIPGNPPAVYFYNLWKEEIRSKHPSANIFISAYPTIANTIDSTKFMHKVMLAHLENFNNFQKKSDNEITILGHSLGSYFALKILEQDPGLVKKTILLHPFIRKPTSKGKLILNTVKLINQKSYLKKTILNNRHKLNLFSKEIAHVLDEELHQAIHMGFHESKTIGLDSTPLHFPESLKPKIMAFCHPKDTWCSQLVITSLKDQIKTTICYEPHGFITQKSHRDTLWGKILDNI